MADRNRSSVKKKEKVESKANDGKEKGKEKSSKKPDKPPKVEAEKKNQENGGATGTEVNKSEENEDFQPMELPPFEIVTGWVLFHCMALSAFQHANAQSQFVQFCCNHVLPRISVKGKLRPAALTDSSVGIDMSHRSKNSCCMSVYLLFALCLSILFELFHMKILF